jgi:crotonobetainyl-CoA:carnitine CoA-transferase CaiB-like acyl-CoA transferase
MKLEGIRVLDLSLFLPGPLMTQMMADHGAEVIKLEPIGEGEPNREIGAKRDGVSVFFANTHRNKKSIQLNLKTDEGREAALRLAETCDVMVEAFRPGVVKRLGVDYDAVAARNPAIVYASISAFGQDGPYVTRPAHDMATQAYAGILSVNLGFDSKPAIPGLASADMLSSMMALSGVLMALYKRKETGRGDYLDMAMMDSVIAAMPNNYGPVFAEKRAPVPTDERSWGGNAMYRIYETKDGKFIVLGGAEIHFAQAILEKMGRPDLLPLCQPPPGPNQDPVKQFLAERFKSETQDYWIEWFDGLNAAFAPVNTLRQAADDPHAQAREMFFTDERGWEHIGIPIKFRDEPGSAVTTFAGLGEHTEAVLGTLGYGEEEIKAMKDKGVF